MLFLCSTEWVPKWRFLKPEAAHIYFVFIKVSLWKVLGQNLGCICQILGNQVNICDIETKGRILQIRIQVLTQSLINSEILSKAHQLAVPCLSAMWE